jgi:hypothetical protein
MATFLQCVVDDGERYQFAIATGTHILTYCNQPGGGTAGDFMASHPLEHVIRAAVAAIMTEDLDELMDSTWTTRRVSSSLDYT